MPAQFIDSDLAETYRPSAFAVGAAPAAGRYEGSVKRESDGAMYLRAIELGNPAADGTIPIRIYDQLGGQIPPSPQFSGEAFALGSIILFSTSDSIAKRRFISVVLGTYMISASSSTYFDGRPDSKLAGVLRKV
ncbi:MAG TPA: hypothetical protein PLP42_06340 [Acidobacteriota bacterium]|nr:hypothetical protein [Acidobacteriota bacterium]